MRFKWQSVSKSDSLRFPFRISSRRIQTRCGTSSRIGRRIRRKRIFSLASGEPADGALQQVWMAGAHDGKQERTEHGLRDPLWRYGGRVCGDQGHIQNAALRPGHLSKQSSGWPRDSPIHHSTSPDRRAERRSARHRQPPSLSRPRSHTGDLCRAGSKSRRNRCRRVRGRPRASRDPYRGSERVQEAPVPARHQDYVSRLRPRSQAAHHESVQDVLRTCTKTGHVYSVDRRKIMRIEAR